MKLPKLGNFNQKKKPLDLPTRKVFQGVVVYYKNTILFLSEEKASSIVNIDSLQ